MSITVKQLRKQFEYLKDSDFRRLTGKSTYKDDDTISLKSVASFNKRDIQIFTARKEGNQFLNILQGPRKAEIAQAADINIQKNNNRNSNPFSLNNNGGKNNALGAYIPPEMKNWIA